MPERSKLPVAVVACGSTGIGREVCRRLAAIGYAVVLGARDERDAELAAKELDAEGEKITPRHIEVDNSVNITALGKWIKERYDRVDALVNNASNPPDKWAMAMNTDLSPVAEALDMNLFGAWRLTQEMLPMLRISTKARIVNVTSEEASLAGMSGGRPSFTVSMAALNALTRMLAGELKRDGILVNAVAVSPVPGLGQKPARTPSQDAAGIVWAVTLPNDGQTGTFTKEGREIPW
jgi:NAD(P)-dependent dehydrogenase (short-subunit alcohol dehydrogenase family)